MEEKKYNFIMLVSISTFLIIAIGYDSFLKNFDLRIINFIQGFESSELTIFYKSITDIADTWQSTILVVVITVILYFLKYKREALFLVLTMSTCGIIMSFIKNIFDIDKGAEDYQQRLEVEKQKLLKDRKDKMKVIDDEYNKVLEEEQENLKLHLSSIENEDKNKLVEYNEKSEAIKSVFEDKKEILIKNFADSLLESGEFYGE